MKNSRKIITFLKFIRIQNSLISLFTVFVYSIISFGSIKQLNELLILALITMLSLSSGNIINDISDIDIDRINKPNRPLPSREISIFTAKLIYILFVFSAVCISFYFRLNVPLLVVFNNIMLFFYSRFLKETMLWGNFVVSYLTMSVLLLCAFAFNNFVMVVLPCLFAFFANFIRELVKDLEDLEGDKALNLQTFAIIFSLKTNKLFILFLSILLILSAYLPILQHDVSISYWVLVHLGIIFPIINILTLLKKAVNKIDFSKISKYLKIQMLIGLIILITVKNDITISF